MTTIEGVEMQLHVFFTSALDGGKLSGSCPGYFNPGETTPPVPNG